MTQPTSGAAPIICPACGGQNAPDAVFCANPACHKALGPFRYVLEELEAEITWHERVADKVTDFIGQPHFLTIHLVWFVAWAALNSGLFMVFRVFDAYPFGLLGLILACEAILITGFLLISQNRQNAHANRRAELDYEVNVLSYRRLEEMEATLGNIAARLGKLETVLDEKNRKTPPSENQTGN